MWCILDLFSSFCFTLLSLNTSFLVIYCWTLFTYSIFIHIFLKNTMIATGNSRLVPLFFCSVNTDLNLTQFVFHCWCLKNKHYRWAWHAAHLQFQLSALCWPVFLLLYIVKSKYNKLFTFGSQHKARDALSSVLKNYSQCVKSTICWPEIKPA